MKYLHFYPVGTSMMQVTENETGKLPMKGRTLFELTFAVISTASRSVPGFHDNVLSTSSSNRMSSAVKHSHNTAVPKSAIFKWGDRLKRALTTRQRSNLLKVHRTCSIHIVCSLDLMEAKRTSGITGLKTFSRVRPQRVTSRQRQPATFLSLR